MATPQPDPLDALWSPARRQEARERSRERAIAAADATIATVPAHLLDAFRPNVYRDGIVDSWLASHDEYVNRARTIISAPEAAGREHLARHLIVDTLHSAAAAILILRGAGQDIAKLPVGGERAARLAAMRRATVLAASA